MGGRRRAHHPGPLSRRARALSANTRADVGGAREDGSLSDGLERFGPATQDWFRGAFAQPTAAQAGAWEAISHGRHALVVAPTGSGKTLSA
ncbi:MAG: hypothetical protein R2692_09890, partial [Microbacterium sp.]